MFTCYNDNVNFRCSISIITIIAAILIKMKPHKYISSFTVKDHVEAYAVASHLWHLSHIFRTMELYINGIISNSSAITGSFRSTLKAGLDNGFIIKLSDCDFERITKHIELIAYILQDRYPYIKIHFKVSQTVHK